MVSINKKEINYLQNEIYKLLPDLKRGRLIFDGKIISKFLYFLSFSKKFIITDSTIRFVDIIRALRKIFKDDLIEIKFGTLKGYSLISVFLSCRPWVLNVKWDLEKDDLFKQNFEIILELKYIFENYMNIKKQKNANPIYN